MRNTNTVIKNNLRVIEGDNRQSAGNEELRKKLPIMKTIREMVELTNMPYAYFRRLCLEEKIVYTKTGKKYLINYDRFCDYLNGIEQ